MLLSEKGYYLQRRKRVELQYFESLEEIIQFYKRSNDVLPSPLRYPVACEVQEEDDDTGASEHLCEPFLSRLSVHVGYASVCPTPFLSPSVV